MSALSAIRTSGLDANGLSPLLAKFTTAELRKELSDALRLTANHLNYLGSVWCELVRRGEDLAELRSGIGLYLSKIAAGELLAEVVVRYAGDPRVLRRLSAASLDDQRAALETGVLPFDVSPSRVRRRSLGPRVGARDEKELPLPDNVAMAAVAGPRDVAETIVEMILASKDPEDVADRVRRAIDAFVKKGFPKMAKR